VSGRRQQVLLIRQNSVALVASRVKLYISNPAHGSMVTEIEFEIFFGLTVKVQNVRDGRLKGVFHQPEWQELF
jgi:hypothetical protein